LLALCAGAFYFATKLDITKKVPMMMYFGYMFIVSYGELLQRTRAIFVLGLSVWLTSPIVGGNSSVCLLFNLKGLHTIRVVLPQGSSA
jgi:hypothetical protein